MGFVVLEVARLLIIFLNNTRDIIVMSQFFAHNLLDLGPRQIQIIRIVVLILKIKLEGTIRDLFQLLDVFLPGQDHWLV